MAPYEKELRDYLQNLIVGENSPISLVGEQNDYKIFNTTSRTIDDVYTFELNLSNNSASLMEFIVSEKVEAFMLPIHGITKFPFITKEDERKEYAETNDCSLFKKQTFNNLLKYKKLSLSGVYNYKDAFFNSTYKVEFRTYAVLMSKNTPWELMKQKYAVFLTNEMTSLRYELSKYFEEEYIFKYREIIDFYLMKITDLDLSIISPGAFEFYDLIKKELVKIHVQLLTNNTHGTVKRLSIPFNLVWNGTLEEFINFTRPGIDSGEITYKGTSNLLAIYKILFLHFSIHTQPPITEEILCQALKIPSDSLIDDFIPCKLEWTKSSKALGEFFRKNINSSIPDESKIRCGYSVSKLSIATNISEIFSIKQQNRRNKLVKETSLVKTLRTSW